MTGLRKTGQYLGLIYRDDGSWQLGPGHRHPPSGRPANTAESGSKLSYLFKLGAVFAVCGAALMAAGAAALAHALHGGPGLGVASVLVGVACLGLGGYLAWGYGWLKKRPELVAKAQRHNGPLSQDGPPRKETR